jgi:carbamoyl-phosphate synthase large subunit
VSLGGGTLRRIEEQTAALARELGVVGLMNVQFALQQVAEGARVYVLEVNPRGSRTVPFVSKSTGVPLARIATKVIAGHKLRDLDLPGWEASLKAGRVPRRRDFSHVSVKEAVLPFPRFPGVDTTLGPEMKSTGEVMGVGPSFPIAFLKSQVAAGNKLPHSGTVFISVTDADKDSAVLAALILATLGFEILATDGTHRTLERNGIPSRPVLKFTQGQQARQAALDEGRGAEEVAAITTIVDLIEAGGVDLIINTPRGRGARTDGYEIRRAAVRRGITAITTMAAAQAAVQAIVAARAGEVHVTCLQDIHRQLANGTGTFLED